MPLACRKHSRPAPARLAVLLATRGLALQNLAEGLMRVRELHPCFDCDGLFLPTEVCVYILWHGELWPLHARCAMRTAYLLEERARVLGQSA